MNEQEDRLNPEDFLKIAEREKAQSRGGKLKIFLGMAAGVGKTYAMLEAGQKLQKEGVQIIIGTIDTHGRKDTERLLEGLKVIPEKKVAYKDAVFEELDIDAILQYKPQVVLVDAQGIQNDGKTSSNS